MVARKVNVSINEAQHEFMKNNKLSPSDLLQTQLKIKMGELPSTETTPVKTLNKKDAERMIKTSKMMSFAGLIALMMGLIVPTVLNRADVFVWALLSVAGVGLIWAGVRETRWWSRKLWGG